MLINKCKMHMVGSKDGIEKRYYKTINVPSHSKIKDIDKKADMFMESKWENGSIDHMEMFWFTIDEKEFYDSKDLVEYLIVRVYKIFDTKDYL